MGNITENKLKEFNRTLVEKNKVVNLTAHKTEEQSWQNNILDSLLFLDRFPEKAKVLDIGSGCGCPAIPLKILLPNLDITMVDSVNKKVDFLNQAAAELGLKQIQAIHTRIEDYAAKNRETFDIVTARAVAELPTLLEYAMPFLKVGGSLYAYKGKSFQDEIDKSKKAMRELSCTVSAVHSATLESQNHQSNDIKESDINPPIGDKERFLIIIKKTAPTHKKYPRGKNLPRLTPLI